MHILGYTINIVLKEKEKEKKDQVELCEINNWILWKFHATRFYSRYYQISFHLQNKTHCTILDRFKLFPITTTRLTTITTTATSNERTANRQKYSIKYTVHLLGPFHNQPDSIRHHWMRSCYGSRYNYQFWNWLINRITEAQKAETKSINLENPA